MDNIQQYGNIVQNKKNENIYSYKILINQQSWSFYA